MRKFLIPTVTAALLPGAGFAHGLHDSGTIVAGAMHPISGADHILAMVAVGLLAAQMGGRALWALPSGFVGAMLLGGVMGANGMGFPAVEPMILASIVILGVLVALAARLPMAVVLPVVAVFGAAHGWAHGAEGPAEGLAEYALGFAAMTAGLHGLGLLAGRAINRMALRGLGLGAALAGCALALS